LTIDELAAANGTTARRVRALQTLGLLPHPSLRGRTGIYGQAHQDRLAAVLGLQDKGFSLESLGVLFEALDAGASLADVLGLPDPHTAPAGSRVPTADSGSDAAELYGFAELLRTDRGRRVRPATGRPLLSVVPTTVWDESEAS
jgi:DNA-binding transcriptional MerR regulator